MELDPETGRENSGLGSKWLGGQQAPAQQRVQGKVPGLGFKEIPTLSHLGHSPRPLGKRRRPSGVWHSCTPPQHPYSTISPHWLPKALAYPELSPPWGLPLPQWVRGHGEPHLSSGPSCMQSRPQAGRSFVSAGGWLFLPLDFPTSRTASALSPANPALLALGSVNPLLSGSQVTGV